MNRHPTLCPTCTERPAHFPQGKMQQVFLKCLDTDILEPVLNGASVAILTILQDDDADTSVREHAVVLEGDIVLQNIPDLSTTLAHLFGLLYALNIDYPKQMSFTFEAIQAILF